jgi:hypothetical protein
MVVATAGATVVRVARPPQEEDVLHHVHPLSLVGGERPGPQAQGLRAPDAADADGGGAVSGDGAMVVAWEGGGEQTWRSM